MVICGGGGVCVCVCVSYFFVCPSEDNGLNFNSEQLCMFV